MPRNDLCGPVDVTVVTMGATMFIEVGPDGVARRSADAEKRVIDAAVAACGSDVRHCDVVSLEQRSGAELTLSAVLRARDAALRAVALRSPRWDLPARAAIVFVTGTDALEEFAFALDLLLPRGASRAALLSEREREEIADADADGLSRLPPVACVVTGAMRPANALSPDGAANLRDAILTAVDMADERRTPRGLRQGVIVAMGGLLHSARHVRKVCSDGTAGTAFSSGPGAGPVGSVGALHVTWAHAGPPPAPAEVPMWGGWFGGDGRLHDDKDDNKAPLRRPPLLLSIKEEDLRTRVPIWTLACDAMAPPDALLDCCDGLVLAAPGTGSVAAHVLSSLAPAARARKVPVVLVSRCGAGPSHDAGLYGHMSVRQYSDAGFQVCFEEGGMNPVQARMALSVALTLEAADGRRAREAAAARGGDGG